MKSSFPCLLLLLGGLGTAFAADSSSAAGRAFFETKIRPILVEQCYECHSAESEKLGGKLLLDQRAGLLQGGESGPAIVAGDPEASILVQALRWEHDLEMPPEDPLSEPVVQDFVRWVEMGAPDPRSGELKEVAGKAYEDGALWSYEPVTNPAPPEVADPQWSRDDLDRFVLARMEEMELSPTQDATPEMLIRRLYVDLWGLPPSLDDVRAFKADFSKDKEAALARWVDQLLASPHFGERWGRHWLDVARYAESNGNDGLSRNPTFPHAWRYRDYVIEALNADVPYDQFLTEQIAGDLLKADSAEERDRQRIATGFLALSAKPAKAMNNNFDMDVVADQIDMIGSGIMGISVACARCHDHKTDPIPTKDYYALAGIFTSSQTMWGLAANEKLTAPPTDLFVLEAAPKVLPPEEFVETVILKESNTGKPKEIPKSKWEPGTPLAMGVKEQKGEKIADAQINQKGDAKKLGESVPRGFVTACETEVVPSINPKQSGRLELAQWLTSGSHPQTSRVMVNRIWQHLFGTGLVATPDDFGVYGDRPTHPDLLDHLATRFVEEKGWSIKEMIRTIVLSRTYQLSSLADADLLAADPENLWLTRHERRRMDAETLRDSILQASGQLNSESGEGSIIQHRDILVNLAGNLHEPDNHRSVYLCYLRNSPPPDLAGFDLPDFTKVKGKREVSTVPGQALFLLNSPFVVEQAEHFGERLIGHASDPEERVKFAYRQALSRDPAEGEISGALALVNLTLAERGSEKAAWASLCQALLSTNEFRYID